MSTTPLKPAAPKMPKTNPQMLNRPTTAWTAKKAINRAKTKRVPADRVNAP